MRKDVDRDLAERGHAEGMLARLVHQARTAIADAGERRALRRELADYAMTGNLDSLLAEAGLSRAQIEPLIKGYPEAPRLLEAMAERLGVEEEYKKDPTIQRDLQRTCSLCAAHGRCRRWLHSGRQDGYRDFCPNAELLDFLRRRVAAQRRAS